MTDGSSPDSDGGERVGVAKLAAGMVLRGTYRVVRQIGEGGMGEVYEVTHARLSGSYAVKLLRAEIAANPEAFSRFRREAEITSALRHPNIVNVIDFNQLPDGRMYLVMEFLAGVDLETRLARSGPIPLDQTVTVVEQVASALAAAHSRGVVHRDLKPQNIFLVRMEGQEKEIAKVVDFGISKVKAATKNLTRESGILGTPQYMAPEQALGLTDQIDGRTDQFALGAIAYEMLAGREAFRAESLAAIIYQVVHEEAPSLRGIAREVTAEVDSVIRKAMCKKPAERFGSIMEFASALQAAARTPPPVAPSAAAFEFSAGPTTQALGGTPGPRRAGELEPSGKVTTFSSTASERGRPVAPRRRLVMAAAGAGGLLAVVAGGLLLSHGRPPTPGRHPGSAPPRPAGAQPGVPQPASMPVVVQMPAPDAGPLDGKREGGRKAAMGDRRKKIEVPHAGRQDPRVVPAKGNGFVRIQL